MDDVTRRRGRIFGTVQGVGFRPFLYRLAHAHGVGGWACNSGAGVLLEIEGTRAAVEGFGAALPREVPPLARIASITWESLAAIGETTFTIRASEARQGARTAIPPDVATCAACLTEMRDPASRRYGYPFTNCTDCGPRFTIIEGVPYDRPLTTMRDFAMCPACRAEYDDPGDRRFHAQPNACPDCGPHLRLDGRMGDDAALIAEAAALLRAGRVLAVKGLGGYHLACDAGHAGAVATLRARKGRARKPFALMCATLEDARALCEIDDPAAALLTTVERPIVLLPARAGTDLAPDIAPGVTTLGVMLPYTPLHHLLLDACGGPLVMTSGNVSDEPIAYEDDDAQARLGHLADHFLTHTRPIHLACDDSLAQVVDGVPTLLRRARGYVPETIVLPARAGEEDDCAKLWLKDGLPGGYATNDCRRLLGDYWSRLPSPSPPRPPLPEERGSSLPCHLARIGDGEWGPTSSPTILAVGGDLKNTFCLVRSDTALLSQHLGDLENPVSLAHAARMLEHFCRFFDVQPQVVAHDLHPDYHATRLAQAMPGVTRIGVQHHHAHIAACLAEHGVAGPVIGVAYDGTGFGTDGTIWGGEILIADTADFRRAAHLTPFALPGGTAAIRKPGRIAAALLSDQGMDATEIGALLPALSAQEIAIVTQQAAQGLNSPRTTSMGRLCDAVSALLGVCDVVTYEGQAAIELEATARGTAPALPYTITMGADGALALDTQPLLAALCDGKQRGMPVGALAAGFHATIAAMTVTACCRLRDEVGLTAVALSGGVFQNRRLATAITDGLAAAGFTVYTHRKVPCNDGGLSLGQAAVARAQMGRVQG